MKKITICLFAQLFVVASLFAQIPSGYYDTAEGKSGETLKTALYNVIKGHTEYDYSHTTKTDTWDILKEADRDPNNSDNVIGIYSNFSMNGAQEYNSGKGWSREHVWAKSRGDFGDSKGPGTDCHHIRAEDVSTNSARNNRNFDECTVPYNDSSGATPSFTSSTSWTWEPRPEVKGDVARMIFYMATRYEGENGEPDLELTETLQDKSSKAPLHAKLSVLLAWHFADPVTEEERERNDIIYSYQNNRNPFIDHPEYIDCIWGDGCGSSAEVVISTSVQSLADFGSVATDQFSAAQNYTISASGLTTDLSITASDNFVISEDNDTFSSTLTIAKDEADGKMIYVKFNPKSGIGGSKSGVITQNNGNVSSTISVTGTESTSKTGANITISELEFDYDGEEKAVVITTEPEGLSYEVTYNGKSEAPVDAGSYTVTAVISDDAFEGTNSTTLTINALPIVASITNLEHTFDGLPKEVVVTTEPAGLEMTVIYGNSETAPSEAGSYTVQATASNGNYTGRALAVMNIVNNVSVVTNTEKESDGIRIFPNPATSHFTVQCEKPSAIQLLNTSGKVVQQLTGEGEVIIKTDQLPASLYFLRVNNGDTPKTYKLIVE